MQRLETAAQVWPGGRAQGKYLPVCKLSDLSYYIRTKHTLVSMPPTKQNEPIFEEAARLHIAQQLRALVYNLERNRLCSHTLLLLL